ncbi:MAG: hypothetical protein AUJ52_06775 [Elusimicrobia bacterium CG1_02_63_36]|nr:MAG: hypothetical protein AUJ52_06775 [Elusimicrobia bacterium CG1_02_63_36]
MARGNNKGRIFFGEEDYLLFERILRDCLPRFGVLLYAYALLPNHIHLQIKSLRGKLSAFAQRLLGGYARAFNRAHGRVGHVFQGRFRSRMVRENNYMLELSRYIHMNAVKARLARRPEDYRWCSFRGLWTGNASVPIETALYEQRFPGPNGTADLYRFTVARGIPKGDAAGWAARPFWYADESPEPGPVLPPQNARLLQPEAPEPRLLLEEVAARHGCRLETLTAAWRNPRLGAARTDAMLALRDRGGLSLRDIASLLGLRSSRSVSNALRYRRCMSA